MILAVIAVAGFLVGVAVGLAAMVILFIVSYSRINVVHHAGTGAEIRSSVERCAYHRRVPAEELGRQIHILELQGSDPHPGRSDCFAADGAPRSGETGLWSCQGTLLRSCANKRG